MMYCYIVGVTERSCEINYKAMIYGSVDIYYLREWIHFCPHIVEDFLPISMLSAVPQGSLSLPFV
jgi:hypothetical protein